MAFKLILLITAEEMKNERKESNGKTYSSQMMRRRQVEDRRCAGCRLEGRGSRSAGPGLLL